MQFSEAGGPEVLELVDLPDPTPGPEVLVELTLWVLNRTCCCVRASISGCRICRSSARGGGYPPVGPGVSDFAIGQSVLVFGTGGGHHAELTSAPGYRHGAAGRSIRTKPSAYPATRSPGTAV